MNIDIWMKRVDVDETARTQVERRLLFRLDRFSSRIDGIKVRITDINGPRGGVDTVCRIDIRLRPTGNVFVEDVDADVFAAVDRASDRAARQTARAIKRMQRFERRSVGKKELAMAMD